MWQNSDKIQIVWRSQCRFFLCGRETAEKMIEPAINATRALRSTVWLHKSIREAVEPLDRCQTEAESSIFLPLEIITQQPRRFPSFYLSDSVSRPVTSLLMCLLLLPLSFFSTSRCLHDLVTLCSADLWLFHLNHWNPVWEQHLNLLIS